MGDVLRRHSCSIPLKSRVRRRFFNSDTHPFIELIIPFVGFFEVFARVALSTDLFEIRPAPFFLGELVLRLFEFSGGQSMVTLFFVCGFWLRYDKPDSLYAYPSYSRGNVVRQRNLMQKNTKWLTPTTLLILMSIAMPLAFNTWSALLNNFAVERAAFFRRRDRHFTKLARSAGLSLLL